MDILIKSNDSLQFEGTIGHDIPQYLPSDDDVLNRNMSYFISESPLTFGYNTTPFDDLMTTETPMPMWQVVADIIFKVLLGTNVIVVLFGMGCAIDWKQIVKNLWPPVGILIGMFGQFILLPGMAFTFSKVFDLQPYEAMGCLIVSCCPGGSFSNFATYWLEGELALSVVMTACSSLLALAGMPFNLWLYSGYILKGEANIVVPVWSIVKGLLLVIAPVIVGMIVRHFTVRIANLVTKITGIIAYVGFVAAIGSYIAVYYDVFTTATPLIYAGGIILPISGFLGAYIVALICRRSHKICRTIGIETGCQNMQIAMSVILFSFDDKYQVSKMLLFPTIYGIFVFSEILLAISAYQSIKKLKKKQNEDTYEKSMAYKTASLESGTMEEKSKIKS